MLDKSVDYEDLLLQPCQIDAMCHDLYYMIRDLWVKDGQGTKEDFDSRSLSVRHAIVTTEFNDRIEKLLGMEPMSHVFHK